MTELQAFSLTELAAFIGVALGALAALMATCFKSKCDEVNCCWNGIRCHRVVALEDANNASVPPEINTQPSTTTNIPRPTTKS